MHLVCAGLQAWDAGLAAALREPLAALARQGMTLQLDELPHEVRAVLELALHPGRAAAVPHPDLRAALRPIDTHGADSRDAGSGWLAAFGQRVHRSGQNAVSTVTFFGEVLLALARLFNFGRGASGLRRSRTNWR